MMKKVFIVFEKIEDDNDSIIGVFKNKEDAHRFWCRIASDFGAEHYYYEEYKVH